MATNIALVGFTGIGGSLNNEFTLDLIGANTKGEIRRLRASGFVPVSLQHKGVPTQHYQQLARPIDEYIRAHGRATMLDLVVGPDNRRIRAMVQDLQRDPVTQKLMQVTFQVVGVDDTLKTSVQLVFQGVPEVVTNNEAVVQHRLDRLEIACTQDNLPDHITVDVSHLGHGDTVRVSDLPPHPHYQITTPADTVLASLMSTRTGAPQ